MSLNDHRLGTLLKKHEFVISKEIDCAIKKWTATLSPAINKKMLAPPCNFNVAAFNLFPFVLELPQVERNGRKGSRQASRTRQEIH